MEDLTKAIMTRSHQAKEGVDRTIRDIFIAGDRSLATKIDVDYRPSYSIAVIDGETMLWVYRDDEGWRPF